MSCLRVTTNVLRTSTLRTGKNLATEQALSSTVLPISPDAPALGPVKPDGRTVPPGRAAARNHPGVPLAEDQVVLEAVAAHGWFRDIDQAKRKRRTRRSPRTSVSARCRPSSRTLTSARPGHRSRRAGTGRAAGVGCARARRTVPVGGDLMARASSPLRSSPSRAVRAPLGRRAGCAVSRPGRRCPPGRPSPGRWSRP